MNDEQLWQGDLSIDGSPAHEERSRPHKFVRHGAGRYGYSEPIGRDDDGLKTGMIFPGNPPEGSDDD